MSHVRKDVLNGWKEIAAYLGRDPRTVERWEKQRSLPVRRLPGGGRATVYALVSELDAWLAGPIAASVPSSLSDAVTKGIDKKSLAQGEPIPKEDPVAASTPVPPQDRDFAQSGRPRDLWRWAVAVLLLISVCMGWGLALSKRSGVVHSNETGPNTESSHLGELVPNSPVAGVEDLYLHGAYEAELRTPDALHRAQADFARALAMDPRYAPAFAGLAGTYILLREYSTFPDDQAYARAQEAAAKAVALNPKLPQAHAVLGFVDFFGNWNGTAAEREFQTALKLQPSMPLAHHWYGSMLTHEGAFRDGLRELTTAQRLDPSSSAILTMRAYALGLDGRRDEARVLLQEAIRFEQKGQYRNPATMHQVLGTLCLLTPRDIPQFISESMLASQLREDTPMVAELRHAAQVYRAGGEGPMWQGLLADQQLQHKDDQPTYAMARYEAQLGQKDRALADLQKLFVRHDAALIGISVDPLFVSLHQDPRFLQIRTAMGLPKADWQ